MASFNKCRRVDLYLSCRRDSCFPDRGFIGKLSKMLCDELASHAEECGAKPSLFCRFLHAMGMWKRDVSLALMRLRIGGLGVCLITPDYFDDPACSAEMQCLWEMKEESLIDLRLFSLGWPAHQKPATNLKNRFPFLTELVIVPLDITSISFASTTLAERVWNIWDRQVPACHASGYRSCVLGATRRESFSRLLSSVFTQSDLPQIRSLFGMPSEYVGVLDAFCYALQNGKLNETDVGPLKKLALLSKVGKEKKLTAIDEYKRKWIDTDGLSWEDDEERARFICAFDDAQNQSVGGAGRSTVLGKRTRPDIETQGDRYCVVHNVPENPHYVQLSLDTPGSCDSKLKEKILSSDSSKSIFAVACGMVGVGKTCALRGIGRLPEVKSRFFGGTFFAHIGGDGGVGRLIEVVADMVWESGGHGRAENIRTNKSLKFAIEEAGKWFENKRCLFMFDDVWCVKGIFESDLERAASLARHPGSRVVLSSRDIKVALHGSWVKFERRDKAGCESAKIILRCAGFEKSPSEMQAWRAYSDVLDVCNGLPLMLAFAGRALKSMVLRGCDESKVWIKYAKRISEKGVAAVSTSDEEVRKFERSVALSVELLEEEYGCGNWPELLDSLCIARRQIPVPLHVFQRLWNADADSAEEMVEKLGNFCLVHISTEERGSIEETVVLVHDEILNYVRRRTERRGSGRGKREEISDNLIQSYLSSDKAHAPFAEAVRQVEDDGYIFENIFHLLRESGSVGRAMELITDPRWVVGQMAKDGVGKISGDVEICFSMLHARRNIPSDCNLDMAVEFCRALQNACYNCAYDNRGCAGAWRNWFELYGRLSWLEENEYVKRFLGGIVTWAPRPWLKPSRGLLPAAVSSLKHVITVPENCKILCERIDSDGVLICYANRVTKKLYTKKFQRDNATETDPVEFPYYGELADILVATFTTMHEIIFGMEDGEVQINDYRNKEWPKNLCLGHYFSVCSLSISSDGKKIVSGSGDKSVRVWENGGIGWKCEVLTGHNGSVKSVSISSDGESIVSGSNDKSVRMWKKKGNCWRSEVLIGHTMSVRSVGISSDGKRIVSGSDDKSVRVWEQDESRWRSDVLIGHTDGVSSVSISWDGKRIASGSYDRSVRVWEDDGIGWRSEKLTGHADRVMSVNVSSNGKKVVSGSRDKSVRVWEHDGSGWHSEVLTGHTGWVSSVSISLDGKRIVSGSYDKTNRVWDEHKESRWWCCEVLAGHTRSVRSVCISPEGNRVVSGSEDKCVRVWEDNGNEWLSESLTGHTDSVMSISYTLDGRRMVSGSNDRFVRVWEYDGMVWRSELLRGHTEPVLSVSFSSNGNRVVSGSRDKSVRVWERDGNKWHSATLLGHTDWVRSVRFSLDGNRIVSGSNDKSVRVWEYNGSRWRCEVLSGHTNQVTSVSFSSNGNLIASGSEDKSVRVWEHDGTGWRNWVLTGHTGFVTSVSFSSDGRRIVSRSEDQSARVWERDGSGFCNEVYSGHTDLVSSVNTSSDGRRVVSGGDDKVVCVWESVGGEWRNTKLLGHADSVKVVGISPDGKRVVSQDTFESVRMWTEDIVGWHDVLLPADIRLHENVGVSSGGGVIASLDVRGEVRVCENDCENDESVWRIEIFPNFNSNVSITQGGRRIVTASDRFIHVWCQDGGEWLREVLKGHTGVVRCVDISSDGKRIVSGSNDNSVRVWERDDNGWCSEELTTHDGHVTSVSISSDGKRIVSGSNDKFQVWELDRIGWCELLTRFFDKVMSVSISSDGNRIAAGGIGRSVRVLEHDGRGWRSEVLTGHTGSVTSLRISSDGKRIVSGSNDSSVRVWEHDGKRWRSEELTGHTGEVVSVSISSDGKRIVSGSLDLSVRIWEDDGRSWHSEMLSEHGRSVASVSISSDGKRIVSGSGDACVRVWKIGMDGEWRFEDTPLELSSAVSDTYSNSPRVVIEDDGKHIILFKAVVGGVLQWIKTSSRLRDVRSYKNLAIALPTKSVFTWRKDARFSVAVRNMLSNVCERLAAKEVFVTASGICFKLSRPPFLAFIDVVDVESSEVMVV